jgi:hypothetical protein
MKKFKVFLYGAFLTGFANVGLCGINWNNSSLYQSAYNDGQINLIENMISKTTSNWDFYSLRSGVFYYNYNDLVYMVKATKEAKNEMVNATILYIAKKEKYERMDNAFKSNRDEWSRISN